MQPNGPDTRQPDLADITAHLAATELFGLLDPAALRELAALFTVARFSPGQSVGRQGQIDASLWVVTAGQLAIDRREADGRVTPVATRSYGAVIGQRGVFLSAPRTTSAVTLAPTVLLCVDGEALWRLLRDRPGVIDRMILPDEIRNGLALQPDRGAVTGERTVAVFRRHWLALVRGLVVPAAMLAAMTVVALLLAPHLGSAAAILLLAVLALGLPLAGAVWSFLDYHYDCLIVTNRRVIHIERTPLVDARRREAPLARIQDVQAVQSGLGARLLGYGNVAVQTAGTSGSLRFTMAARPERIRASIFEQLEQAHVYDRQQHRAWVAGQMREVFGDGEPGRAEAEDVDESPSLRFEDIADGRGSVAAAIMALMALPLPKLRIEDGSVVTWRKHWWVLFRKTFLFAVATLLLAGAMAYLLTAQLHGGPPPADRPAQVAVIGMLLAVSAFLWWWRFEDWRNDLYQLTDEHVIDIERRPLGLLEDRRQARLAQVQDIRYDIPNPLARLLNYGHVEIETAAETGSFAFNYVHDPQGVQEEIFERMERERARRQNEDRDRHAEELKIWLAEYHRLMGHDPGSAATPLGPA